MAVYATCTYHLYRSKKFPWMQQIYITVLFILAAVTIACNINFDELAWIDERNYPGGRYLVNGSKSVNADISPSGPLAFINEQEALSVDTIGNSAGLVITFLVDSLLVRINGFTQEEILNSALQIYRCWIVWNSNYYVIVLPTLMLIASTGKLVS